LAESGIENSIQLLVVLIVTLEFSPLFESYVKDVVHPQLKPDNEQLDYFQNEIGKYY
jgi:hypothetical protein